MAKRFKPAKIEEALLTVGDLHGFYRLHVVPLEARIARLERWHLGTRVRAWWARVRG